MKEDLDNLIDFISKGKDLDNSKAQAILSSFLKKHVKGLHIENYIGDYPTFMEPIYLGNNVKIGDDVLLGPNVYVGNNSKIGNYCEISNSIILNNVKLGENFKLENCIIDNNSSLNFNNLNIKDSILYGESNLKEKLKKITF